MNERFHGNLINARIPSAYGSFLLTDSISYSFLAIYERSGGLLIFDDLGAEANKEIIMLKATTILGFVIGLLLGKIFKF